MNSVKSILKKIFTSNITDGKWLIALRVGAALALIGKLLSEFSCINLLYGSNGFVPVDIAAFSQHPYLPTILRYYHLLAGHCSEAFFLKAFFIVHLVFAISLLAGYMTRFSAFVCWAMMVTLFNSSHLTSYGFDAMLLALLFYCLVFPVGIYHSMDSKTQAKDSDMSLLPFYHKTIQLHICLIYFVNGISKVQGAGWHDGGGMWDAINQPQFHSVLTPLLRRLMMINHMPSFVSWSIILIEVSYPFLIWVKKVNLVILILIILLHILIALIMGLWLFAFAMIVFNLVAFGHLLFPNTDYT